MQNIHRFLSENPMKSTGMCLSSILFIFGSVITAYGAKNENLNGLVLGIAMMLAAVGAFGYNYRRSNDLEELDDDDLEHQPLNPGGHQAAGGPNAAPLAAIPDHVSRPAESEHEDPGPHNISYNGIG